MQNEEVEWLEKEMPRAEKGPDKIQISADGAMAPLLHGVWGEGRTLVIGEAQPAVEKKGEKGAHTRNLSYFSRKVSAQEFQRLALVEMHRRGVENAKEVAAIMDGADWEQGFIDYHCPRATRILDFPQSQAISSNLAYLEKRKQQTQYPLFQAQGWPIGSGSVESGNKLVVAARLKGSGMHWAKVQVNPLLALRNIICSDRWKEE
jgi:hypothetical protein